MSRKAERTTALAYLRTSSATNVGVDKDSEKRQRDAITVYAKRAGYAIVDWFSDAAVSGEDDIGDRSGEGYSSLGFISRPQSFVA